jgi:hypothetical protein
MTRGRILQPGAAGKSLKIEVNINMEENWNISVEL